MLGETPEQNAEGIRAIQVYNRDDKKRMKDGQRYHQSREGGSIHTDNVNIPELWDYMALTCLQVWWPCLAKVCAPANSGFQRH
jgi:hypothetical protein